ncbi:MAG: heme exporter protein CcmB [Gammaproteobacteria bacterium]|nr:heme exporter protein CcmB [Gammaproteobacteria bacterium]
MRFWALYQREMLIEFRSGVESFIPLVFFLLVVGTFAFTLRSFISGDARVLVAVIWITTLFTSMLSLDKLFKRDHADGTLAVAVLHSEAITATVVTKLVTHWSVTGIPITLLGPVVGLLSGMHFDHALMLGFTLLIGTPTITMLGALVTALLVGLGRGGELLTVLILPLYIPILLFGISVCHLHIESASYTSELLWCFALLTGSTTAIPLALGPVLKMSQDS